MLWSNYEVMQRKRENRNDQFNPNHNLAKFGDVVDVAFDDIDES